MGDKILLKSKVGEGQYYVGLFAERNPKYRHGLTEFLTCFYKGGKDNPQLDSIFLKHLFIELDDAVTSFNSRF